MAVSTGYVSSDEYSIDTSGSNSEKTYNGMHPDRYDICPFTLVGYNYTYLFMLWDFSRGDLDNSIMLDLFYRQFPGSKVTQYPHLYGFPFFAFISES